MSTNSSVRMQMRLYVSDKFDRKRRLYQNECREDKACKQISLPTESIVQVGMEYKW